MNQSKNEKFNKYDLSGENSFKNWEESNMYRTSYFQMSEKNSSALCNSTVQLLKTQSSMLNSISFRPEYKNKHIESNDFISYDSNNQYRTSYRDMSIKLPKITNTHFIPGYRGFAPGMKSENPFGSNSTRLSKEKLAESDNRRSSSELNDYKDWQYNPLSKIHGNFSLTKTKKSVIKTLSHHDFTNKLKDSGYTINHFTNDRSGWVPDKSLDGDMKRSEYRIQYNTKKGIHYKGPLFSTGILRKKQQVYKHT